MSKLLNFLLAFFTFTFLLFTFSSPAFAQSPTHDATTLPTTNHQLPTNVSPTSPLFTDLLINNIFHSFSCLAVGQSTIGQPCLTYQVTKDAQGAVQSVPVLSSVNLSGGALGATTSLIGALYTNPPVRTIDYLASVGQGLGIVKVAQAQVIGSGAAVLNPILTLWQTSRNIAYVLMIIIFLIIGLMVMFRNKINPQTVITAQAALPGLVIGLIMITFSYFLAGLISDMAFVGTNVVGYYFAAAQGPSALADPERINLVGKISGSSILTIFGAFIGIASDHSNGIFDSIINSLPNDVATTVRVFIGFLSAQFVAPLGGLAGPWAPIASGVLALLGGATGVLDVLGLRSMIIKLAVVAILLYAMFQLLIRLLNSYLTIIFLTVSAPFQFLFASLPGRQGNFTAWVMNMLGNILVFPAVIAVFYFVAILLAPVEPRIKDPSFPLKVSEINRIQQNNFLPSAYADESINVVDRNTFPLLGGMDLSFVRILLAFAAMIALPAIPNIVVRTIGKASEAGQLIGQELGGNIRAGQGYASQYSGRITGTTDTVSKGIIGESQMMMGKDNQPVRVTTREGLWQIGKRRFGGSPKPPTS